MTLDEIDTPAAVLDTARMAANIARMQAHLDELGVSFRPHVKTSKCAEVVRAQQVAGARGITVSTLKEAEQFFAIGVRDIVYAVGIAGAKLPRAFALQQRGCDLKLLTDSVAGAEALAAFGQANGAVFEVWIEIDTDGHRSGVGVEDASLLEIARVLEAGRMRLNGVLTHAGSSYELNQPAALAALAEQERAGCVRAATRLREAGFRCDVVSIGSTPTALAARRLDGVTEVRAGVYVFFDLVMRNVGVCSEDDIALSVLTTVIGHQADKGWAIVDAGWMAMSRDRGTARQAYDYGYGRVCTRDGVPLPCRVVSANQEHGIVAFDDGAPDSVVERLALGTRLRILPNHACATGAQFPAYHALDAARSVSVWPRFSGW